MVAPIHTNTNRKGIYKDLYREIDADNKKKDASQARKPRKGMYVELYRQLETDKQNITFEKKNQDDFLQLTQSIIKVINETLSKISYFSSFAAGRLKLLIVAGIVAKKPLNSYIENNWDIHQNSIR